MTQWQQTQELARNAGFKDYQEYLESSHWINLKSRCDLRECCVCGGENWVLGHHIRYRNLVDVVPEDIAPMCKLCHDDFHMACRHWKKPYVGMEVPEIRSTTLEFKQIEWYQRWKARQSKKRTKKREKVRRFHGCEWWVEDKDGNRLVTLLLPQKIASKLVSQIRKHYRELGPRLKKG